MDHVAFNKACRLAVMISSKGLKRYNPETNRAICPHCGKSFEVVCATFENREQVLRFYRDGYCPLCQKIAKEV